MVNMHRKMLITIHHHRNANKIRHHTTQLLKWQNFEALITSNAGEDVEQQALSFTAGGNAALSNTFFQITYNPPFLNLLPYLVFPQHVSLSDILCIKSLTLRNKVSYSKMQCPCAYTMSNPRGHTLCMLALKMKT